MNFFDIIFIIVFCWSIYKGFTKGFIIMLASIFALILGVVGTIKLFPFIEILLKNSFNMHSEYISIIAFAITFILIIIIVHLLARLIEKMVESISLGFLNRIAGVVFSVFKTALLISILLVILNEINRNASIISENQKNNSLLYKPLSSFAPALFPFLKFEYYKIQYGGDEDEKNSEI